MSEPNPFCHGCNGRGRMTDDPDVLRCDGCGGVFTYYPITIEQAMKFVGLQQPMAANAGSDGSFYFDFLIRPKLLGTPIRSHGWADTKTKRVVQYG